MDSHKIILLCFLITFSIPFSSSQTKLLPNKRTTDHFLLALQWGPSMAPRRPGAPANPAMYTIHGLWPGDSTNPVPLANCDTILKDHFDVKNLQPRMTDMQKYWPSLTSRTDEWFWEHEWDKHGTCSGLSQLEYFSLALDLTLGELHLQPSLDAIAASNNFMPEAGSALYGISGNGIRLKSRWPTLGTTSRYQRPNHDCASEREALIEVDAENWRAHHLCSKTSPA
ncbi:hypothetical protein IFM89_021013 [Coptis chinensis]|uniref:Uncharacterized protein n=1 Tax=Coptis chinensis TaxID=261450 RepID=A0A835LI22_9MAGN|nr:hypothetical protein IFM89_021013 [Coptis chinensis]